MRRRRASCTLLAAALAACGACLSPPAAPDPAGKRDGGPGPDAEPGTAYHVDPGLGGGHRTFCAVRGPDRQLWCWGENEDGQLALGAFDPPISTTPVPALVGPGLPLTGVMEAVAGDAQACAVLEDRTVRCWGRDDAGQLGDGAGTTGDTAYADRQVTGLDDVNRISSVGRHVCTVDLGGALRCWGRDIDGELGDGPPQSAYAPQPHPVIDEGDRPVEDARAVGVGKYHTCAVRADGSVVCAGLNDNGQLGRLDGEPFTCARHRVRTVPVPSGGALESASQVAGNIRHTCAVAAGGVYCWGYPGCGQLGDGGTAGCAANNTPGSCEDGPTAAPAPVAFPPGAACEAEQVELGFAFSCARCADGRVFCWGNGADGQLGDGGVVASRTPVEVLGITQAVDLAVAEATACVLLEAGGGEDGEVWCWGRGSSGELGDGSAGPDHSSVVAAPVMGLP